MANTSNAINQTGSSEQTNSRKKRTKSVTTSVSVNNENGTKSPIKSEDYKLNEIESSSESPYIREVQKYEQVIKPNGY